MEKIMECPVCASRNLLPILRRERLPVMQNVVYPTRESAVTSSTAEFRLTGCSNCGFCFNSAFDATIVKYDETYDNDVPSPAFLRYYENLAHMLSERFGLDGGGSVYDVGCGKGTFLHVLARLAPGISGVGIDPSCEPQDTGSVKLIREKFSRAHFGPQARLVLLRHVLEHLERPVEFLTELRSAAPEVPLYVEVPDVRWIYRSGAFWDFCYEHVNYFDPTSLRAALARAGYRVIEQSSSFDGQYQWAICVTGDDKREFLGEESLRRAQKYAADESQRIDAARDLVHEASRHFSCALWGMATKGVVFASLVGADVLAGGVDVNVRKQGRFAAGTGLAIHAPDWLAQFGSTARVFVMNPNYLSEIIELSRSLAIKAQFTSV